MLVVRGNQHVQLSKCHSTHSNAPFVCSIDDGESDDVTKYTLGYGDDQRYAAALDSHMTFNPDLGANRDSDERSRDLADMKYDDEHDDGSPVSHSTPYHYLNYNFHHSYIQNFNHYTNHYPIPIRTPTLTLKGLGRARRFV